MRFLRIGLCAAACAALVVSSAAAAGFGVRVRGGMSRVSYGDFNEFADGINALIAADPTITGELATIRWIPEIAVEATMPVSGVLTLGFGAGLLRGSSSYELSAGSSTLSFEHRVGAYPLTATLYAAIPAPFAFARPYAFAGAGAYYATAAFEQRLGAGGDVFGYDSDLSAWGWGLHGGAGLSFAVAPTVSIEIGVQGRYAVVDGFEGTATSTEGETADVVLGFYEGEEGYMVFGPVNAADAAGVDEGAVDLSGFGFTLGATISF